MRIPTIVALTLLVTQSQAPRGVLEGRVLRAGTREPISDVTITLVAPVPANAATNLAPEAAARLTSQITDLTTSAARAGLPQDVVDSAIENARRNATAASSRPVTVMTDGSGHFSFRDLAPGRYTVRAEKEGYFAAPLNGTAPTAQTKSITLEEGKTASPVDLLMVKGAVVSGRIRDPNGQAISGMNVSVYRVTYSNGRKMWTAFNSKATDDRGEYRIYWLFPGEYYVGVTPRAPGPIPGPQDSWARTFYPSAIESGEAMPIEIRDGTEVSGIDINIRTAATATFKISGVAINPDARQNPTGAVDRSISSFVLSPREPGVLDPLNPVSVVNALPVASRGNGEFELRNIRPGSYDLYPLGPVFNDPVASVAGPAVPVAQLPPAGLINSIQIAGGTVFTSINTGPGGAPISRRQPTSRTPVEVNRDITDLRISVSNGVTLSGEVRVSGSAIQSLKFESLRLNLRALDTTPASFVNLIGAIPVDAAGKFTSPNVPEARYTVQVTGIPANAYIADIRQGGVSVMDKGFVLDSAATPIQIEVDTNGVVMQGSVLNADNKPVAAATVVIVPPISRRGNSLLYRNAVTNEEGAFTLRGVPPGTYTIFAWESVLPTAWQNAEFLSKYEGRGRQINITAGSVAEVQLNVIP